MPLHAADDLEPSRLADALLDRPTQRKQRLIACQCRTFQAGILFVAVIATALLCMRQMLLNILTAMPQRGYTEVGMQCVSEFNWNQGQDASYKSATKYFVGAHGSLAISDAPDCAGWTAAGDTLTLKGDKQPRMFLKDGRDRLLMID